MNQGRHEMQQAQLEKVSKALEGFGIIPSPTEASCRQTLRYIFASGDTPQPDRVARVKAAQNKYLGKRVVTQDGSSGMVLYIRACNVPERVSRDGSGPIVAHIEWDGGRKSTCSVSQLQVL